MTAQAKRALALPCAALLALGLAGCTKSVSTSAFKGEQREVAQAIANLQTDATAVDEQKLCTEDLASAVVARLAAASGGCKQAIKHQLAEVDNLELTVQTVVVNIASGPSPATARRTARANVRSVYAGKTHPGIVYLVKESGKWKISGVSEL